MGGARRQPPGGVEPASFQAHARQQAAFFGIVDRIIEGRGLGQTGKQRRLIQIQVFGVDAEIRLGRRLNAVGQVAIVDLIQVELEDLVFADSSPICCARMISVTLRR